MKQNDADAIHFYIRTTSGRRLEFQRNPASINTIEGAVASSNASATLREAHRFISVGDLRSARECVVKFEASLQTNRDLLVIIPSLSEKMAVVGDLIKKALLAIDDDAHLDDEELYTWHMTVISGAVKGADNLFSCVRNEKGVTDDEIRCVVDWVADFFSALAEEDVDEREVLRIVRRKKSFGDFLLKKCVKSGILRFLDE